MLEILATCDGGTEVLGVLCTCDGGMDVPDM